MRNILLCLIFIIAVNFIFYLALRILGITISSEAVIIFGGIIGGIASSIFFNNSEL